MKSNFVRADNSNLPKIDAFMVALFFKNNADYYAEELKNVKTAVIVAFILGDKTLFDQLKDTLASVSKRLKQMRMYLREELERLGAPGTWVHITNQVGNFCFTGFNDIQVQHMKKQHHIYMLSSGRLTVSGLNPDNVEYVARSMNQTLQMIPPTYIAKHSKMCPFN